MSLHAANTLGSYQETLERHRARIPGYVAELSDISAIPWKSESGQAFTAACQQHLDATWRHDQVVAATALALAELHDAYRRRLAAIAEAYETTMKYIAHLAALADDAAGQGLADAALMFTEKRQQLVELSHRYEATDARWLALELDVF